MSITCGVAHSSNARPLPLYIYALYKQRAAAQLWCTKEHERKVPLGHFLVYISFLFQNRAQLVSAPAASWAARLLITIHTVRFSANIYYTECARYSGRSHLIEKQKKLG
jgi:hypothetical protein